MPAFVNQPKEINRVILDLVADVERERLQPAAGKAVRADVVAAAPANDLACLPRDAFVENAGQSLGNFTVLALFACQVIAKLPAENRLHSRLPKTSSNVSPESLPVTKFLSR